MSDIRLEKLASGVFVLTIDQADRRVNILTRALWAELDATLRILEAEVGVPGLVLRSGKPGGFIAGADLHEFENLLADNPDSLREYLNLGNQTLHRLSRLPMPTLAYVDGYALGGGLELALACDFRFAGRHARTDFGFPEVKLGLIPGWGGTLRLPRVVGLSYALELLCLGTTVNAEQAVEMNLVGAVISEDRLMNNASTVFSVSAPTASRRLFARNIEAKNWPLPEGADAENPAVQAVYQVAFAGCRKSLEDGLVLETEAFLKLAGSEDSHRRIREFFEARNKNEG